ncbi:hybrid sensor histidine kinase/response regulator [Halorubrum laminariae]|uniref:histidine kinase n=1 Tax=Halorubrum laminariae TaxID=1433523 RepID=A0ABD6C2D3_9EURY|nr:ATP-binding protein [Halorubrum laminariae]
MSDAVADALGVLAAGGDPAVVEHGVSALEDRGCDVRVETVTTTSAGLKRIRSASVDCVVSDHRPPEWDGIEFLRRVREIVSDVPFVLYTADGSEAVASEAIAAGVTDYVPRDPPGESDESDADADDVGDGTDDNGGDGVDGTDSGDDALAAAIRSAVERAGQDGETADTANRHADHARRLETLVSNLPGFVYRCRNEPEWPMEIVKGDSESVTGYTTAELESDEVVWGDDVLLPDDAERTWEVVQEAMDSDSEFEVTYRIHTKDGSIKWMWERGQLVTPEDGDEPVLEGFIFDITERKRYEEELERRNRELERFTSIVSHDLRNPLNVASGRVELAREEVESNHLDRAAAAHEHMESLIDDLLELARSGERITETEPVSLSAVVRRAWRNVATGDATLAVEIDRTVEADPSRLAQLVENLARNAVEHAGDDVTVTVGEIGGDRGPTEGGDSQKRFYVEDNGPGIPEEHREDVFEMGFSTEEDGTGFGLPIVAQIAEAHGWNVEATAGTDGGARIAVTGVEWD